MGYTREQLESMEHPAVQQIAKKLGISPAGQTRTTLIREIVKHGGANGASVNGAAKAVVVAKPAPVGKPAVAAAAKPKPAPAPKPAPVPKPPVNPEAAQKPAPKAAAPATTTHPAPDHRAEVRALIAAFDARVAAWKAEVEDVYATTQRLLAGMNAAEAADVAPVAPSTTTPFRALRSKKHAPEEVAQLDAEVAAEAAAQASVDDLEDGSDPSLDGKMDEELAAEEAEGSLPSDAAVVEPEEEGDGDLTPELIATMPLRLLRQACRDLSLPFNSAKDGEEVLRAKLMAALEEAGAAVAEEPPPEDTFEDDAPPSDPAPPPAPKRKPAVAASPKPAGPLAGVAPVPPARLAAGMKCRLYWPEDPDLGDKVYDAARVEAFDLDAGTAEVVFTGEPDEDGNTEFLSSGTPLAKVFPPAPVARRKA